MLGMLASKIGMYGIVLTVIVAVVGGFYWHYTNVLKQNEAMAANLAVAEQVIKQANEATLAAKANADRWQQAHEDTLAAQREAARVSREAAEGLRRLNDVFSKHDVGELARKKPVLIERRVNRATADSLRMLRDITSGRGDLSAPAERTPADGTASPEAD